MHQQLRSQILDALSPDHRTAVADAIGQMVISPSPDPAATAKQIDGVLSAAEQQRILSLHGTFVSQSRALMQQLHDQLARQGAGTGPWSKQPSQPMSMPGENDAGNVVLMVLAHRSPMGGGMPGMHGMHGAPGGPQPPGAPPPSDGAPPPGGPPPGAPPP